MSRDINEGLEPEEADLAEWLSSHGYAVLALQYRRHCREGWR